MATKKTRFCPSPTGLMHLGNLRTALLNFLLSKQSKGSFILRIEDTDKERSKKEFAELICDDLTWMDLNWEEGPRTGGPQDPYFQSERNQLYEKFYAELIDKDLIYPCFATEEELKVIRRNQLAAGKPPRYPGIWSDASKEDVQKEFEKGSKPVYRFRIPKKKTIAFNDLIKGEQSFNADDLDDFIVKKEDGSPTFMYANAIDDALMNINLVVRGDDHLSNTPRQIALLEALQLDIPEYAHIALFTGDDGSPLSKRNGSLSIQEIKEKGYFPLAVANYLARVGHTIGDNEVRDLTALAKVFDTNKVSSSPSRFDIQQLNFWQKQVVEAQSDEELNNWLNPFLEGLLPKDIDSGLFVKTIRENIAFPEEAISLANNIMSADFKLSKEAKNIIKASGNEFFSLAKEAFLKNWPSWTESMKDLSSTSGKKGKELYQPIRISLTGQESGPKLDQLSTLLGKERVIERLEKASKI